MPISQELDNSIRELCNATSKPSIVQKCDEWIRRLNETTDSVENISIWKEIIEALNPEYYIARDNTIKFKTVQPHIAALECVVKEAILDLDGKVGLQPEIAEAVTQFIFKVSNYYSIASTLDPENFTKCSVWLENARKFIENNNLLETKQHAIWYNLIGGHKSREYQMGRTKARPNSCVEDFRNALHIRREILRNSLDVPADVDLRHVQMCYVSTLMQDAMWLVINSDPKSPEVQQACIQARHYLDELTDERLVLRDGSPDFYRRAGCTQARGYVQMVEGNFQEACSSMAQAVALMRHSIETTGSTGQLSALLNDEANALMALATATKANGHVLGAQACLRESIRLSEGQLEQMYADVAKHTLNLIEQNIAEVPGVALAVKVLHDANADVETARPAFRA